MWNRLGTPRQQAVVALSIVTAIVLVLAGARALRSGPEPRWPDRIAVIGLDPDARRQPVRFLAIADPLRQSLVYVPIEAVVEVPGSGFLRAFHAYRLGGAPLVRATFERLFGVAVPYSVVGPGGDVDEVGTNAKASGLRVLDGHEEEARTALLTAKTAWPERRSLEGRVEHREGGPVLVLDRLSLDAAARALGGTSTKVLQDPTGHSPTPTPTPTASAEPSRGVIAPSTIRIEVLNGGEVELAATKTANRLKQAGYAVDRVGDFKPQTRERSVVFYTGEHQRAAEQVARELGYPVEPFPEGLRTQSAVVVLLGHDAKV